MYITIAVSKVYLMFFHCVASLKSTPASWSKAATDVQSIIIEPHNYNNAVHNYVQPLMYVGCMVYYASVGGATRHTVIALSVCLLHHFCGARWMVSSETCNAGRARYYLGCELAKVRWKALF